MAANTGERTLITSIIPPGPTHLLQSVFSLADIAGSPERLALIAGWMSSFLLDLQVRSVPRANILQGSIEQLPFVHSKWDIAIIDRALRLNCMTSAYSDLWTSVTGEGWSPCVAIRNAAERRRALVEIDALVALAMGFTADELTTIYRTQFPVLVGYDNGKYVYDTNGRLVPTSVLSVWERKCHALSEGELTAVHPGSGISYLYELPFVRPDRERDLRHAYERFEKR